MLAHLLVALTALPPAPRPLPVHPGEVRVTVDSAAHTITIMAGPFALPAGHPGEHHFGMQGMMHDHATELPLEYFKWPLTGSLRGFKLSVTDNDGHPLNRRLIHHFNLVNFGRRQLFYAVPEITLAVGQETPDISFPKTIGIPMQKDWPMALIFAWHNESPEPVPAVNVKLVLEYNPENLFPRPLPVLPVYMDVMNPVGANVTFDLPPGRTEFHRDYQLPTSGRIIGIGGHAHDYATALALREVIGDRVRTVADIHTSLDSAGMLTGIEQKLPGIRGRGIPLVAGHTYRVWGSYNSPKTEPIKDGAMVHIVYLFAPNNLADWPKVDPENPDWIKDMAWLDSRGENYQDGMDGMDPHMDMGGHTH